MATEIERAVIELQVLFRRLEQRLSALEGWQGKPVGPPSIASPAPMRTAPPPPAAPPPAAGSPPGAAIPATPALNAAPPNAVVPANPAPAARAPVAHPVPVADILGAVAAARRRDAGSLAVGYGVCCIALGVISGLMSLAGGIPMTGGGALAALLGVYSGLFIACGVCHVSGGNSLRCGERRWEKPLLAIGSIQLALLCLWLVGLYWTANQAQPAMREGEPMTALVITLVFLAATGYVLFRVGEVAQEPRRAEELAARARTEVPLLATSTADPDLAALGARVQTLLGQISGSAPEARSLEHTIGQSVVSFVGGLVLLGGILYFLRYGSDISWLQPTVRVITALAAGAVLIVAGEVLHRLRARPLAAATMATGLAAMMAGFFASYMAFDAPVLSHRAAFAGVVIVGIAGLLASFQLGMQSLATLALGGMYLAPLILPPSVPQPIAMLGYLSVVTAAGLVICFAQRHWYWFRLLAVFGVLAPLYLQGLGLSSAWIFLSLALGLYGVVADSVRARVGMLVTLCLLAGQILLFASNDRVMGERLLTFLTVEVTGWMLLGWGAAVFALVLAWLVRPRSPESRPAAGGSGGTGLTTVASAAVGTVLWCGVAVARLEPFSALTLAGLVWLFALLGLGRMVFTEEEGPYMESGSAVLFTVLCVKWLVFDGFVALANPLLGRPVLVEAAGDTGAASPLANLFLVNGLLIVLAFDWTRTLRGLGREFMGWFITTLGFVALTVETLRAVDVWMPAANVYLGEPWLVKNISLSILWSVYACGISIVGFAGKYAPARWVALGLFGVTVLKVLAVDMASVNTVLRVLCLVILGVLLLVISFLYHRGTGAARPAAV